MTKFSHDVGLNVCRGTAEGNSIAQQTRNCTQGHPQPLSSLACMTMFSVGLTSWLFFVHIEPLLISYNCVCLILFLFYSILFLVPFLRVFDSFLSNSINSSLVGQATRLSKCFQTLSRELGWPAVAKVPAKDQAEARGRQSPSQAPGRVENAYPGVKLRVTSTTIKQPARISNSHPSCMLSYCWIREGGSK